MTISLVSGSGIATACSRTAPMRALGPAVGGARSVVAALFDAGGNNGLVARPAFSTDAYPAAVQLRRALAPDEADRLDAAVSGFDILLLPTIGMSAIAEMFRTWPSMRRSTHPTVSVCVRGPDAQLYVAEHASAFACGSGTPLYALMDRQSMKLLLLGVGWNRASSLHIAETLAEPPEGATVPRCDGWGTHMARDAGRWRPVVPCGGGRVRDDGGVPNGTGGER